MANNCVGKRRVMVVKYIKSQGVAPFAHPTGLVWHIGVWKCKMRCKKYELMRVIHSFTFIVFLIYGAVAFAYDPLDCLNDIAKVDSEIPIGLATRLCSGTWSPEPVKCYQNASKVDDGITRGIAIDLCAGAVSSEKTLDCYYQAGTRRQLNRGLATTLCAVRKPEK